MNDILIAAKNHFHQDQQQLIINVLEEKKGIFGLGAYIKAEVSLNLDPIEEGKKYLLQLLNDFNLTGTVEIIPSKQSITFNVNSDNNGLIIGREGKTLQSIQVLTSQVVNQYTNKHLKVLVDIGSYKENQIIPSPDPASYRETIFLNGTKTPELTLRFSAPGVFFIRKLDCFGEIVHEETKALTASVHTFQVSQGGALFLYPSGASKSDVAIHS